MDILSAVTKEQLRDDLPQLRIGDMLKVHIKVKEGSRERIQIFEGTLIAKNNGGIATTITVRRIASGVGVEKIFPLHSPNIHKIDVVRHGKIRRSKLYYLRDKVGRAAKVKELL